MKIIYFVRHGESELNIGNREQGAEGSLSELGRKQAEIVGKRFGTIPVDCIVSSPYERAKETAEIINRELNKEILYTDFLIERRPPTQFIGVPNTDSEYTKVKDLMMEKRMIDPAWRFADEDNFIDLKERAENALQYLRSLEQETVLAITHLGILKVIIGSMMFGKDFTYREYMKLFWTLVSQNTGITLVEFKESSKHGTGWKLVAWNDYAHLG